MAKIKKILKWLKKQIPKAINGTFLILAASMVLAIFFQVLFYFYDLLEFIQLP